MPSTTHERSGALTFRKKTGALILVAVTTITLALGGAAMHYTPSSGHSVSVTHTTYQVALAKGCGGLNLPCTPQG